MTFRLFGSIRPRESYTTDWSSCKLGEECHHCLLHLEGNASCNYLTVLRFEVRYHHMRFWKSFRLTAAVTVRISKANIVGLQAMRPPVVGRSEVGQVQIVLQNLQPSAFNVLVTR